MLKVILLRITCDARNATSTNKKNKRNEATNNVLGSKPNGLSLGQS